LILLGVPPLVGYYYITPRRAGLSATAGLWFSCWLKSGLRPNFSSAKGSGKS